ncbi:MAG TPA: ABC transporter permease, partial [Clostridia bacterium]|nr:ABC transporter permease [Clostridia bacterium]
MIEYLICAMRNLGRKKIRTILTVSGIMIGVASVIVIGAIGEGGKLAITGQLDQLGINGLDVRSKTTQTGAYSASINDKDVTACLNVKGVQSAMPVVMQSAVSVLRGSQKDSLIWGVSSDAEKIISLKIIHGRMFSQSDVKTGANVCLVDDSFARSAYKRDNISGKKITVFVGTESRELTIIGIVKTGSSLLNSLAGNYIPSFVYMPVSTAKDLKGQVGYDQIAIKTTSDKNTDSIGNKIISKLNQIHGVSDNYVADNIFKQKEKLSNLLSIVTLIISAVGAISLVVAGLGIMTVMTVSVNERTREIGIKKAIGAKKSVVLMEFLFEALLISLIGCLLGIAAGTGISFLASR